MSRCIAVTIRPVGGGGVDTFRFALPLDLNSCGLFFSFLCQVRSGGNVSSQSPGRPCESSSATRTCDRSFKDRPCEVVDNQAGSYMRHGVLVRGFSVRVGPRTVSLARVPDPMLVHRPNQFDVLFLSCTSIASVVRKLHDHQQRERQ